MFRLFACPLLAFALVAPCVSMAVAQEVPSTRFTMERIVFKGTRRFTDERLLAALGMKNGGSYSQQELQDSANKLSNSGMFSQVSYRFSATSAEYNLIDNPKLLPARFENFVWTPEVELIAVLKQRVPFFTGEVPEEGTLADDVGKQIEALLSEKGVKAKVQNMPLETSNEPATMSYTVLEPRVEIAAIRVVGVTPDMAAKLNQPVAKNVGGEYTRTLLLGMEDVILQPLFQENGYLHASFGEPSVKLVNAATTQTAKVELTLPVEQGAQYRIASFSMKGDDAVATEAAKKLSTFKTGDVANIKAFRTEMAKLGNAYVAKGYMGAKVRAVPTFDDAAHTVSFSIDMVAGEIYKLSRLDLLGLDDAQKSKMSSLWKLNAGDVYDPAYAPSFLEKNRAKLGFINGYSLAWTQKISDEAKTVELTIFFRKPGARTE